MVCAVKGEAWTEEPQKERSRAAWTDQREDEWKASLLKEDDTEAVEKLRGWIRPRTAGMFRAPSGHALHIRSVLPPEGVSIVATVAFFHGLHSHVNGGFLVGTVLPRLASEGFAVFAVDLPGHGYSEGRRAYVDDWQDVFDDLEAFLEALLGATSCSSEVFVAGVPDHELQLVREAPLFCLGPSMGGMIAMFMALRIQRNELLQSWLKGAVLVCPALAPQMPPKCVQCLLRMCVAPVARYNEMPASVSKSSFMRQSWAFDLADPRQREIAEMELRDCNSRFPNLGLGWSRRMLWGTANSFSKLYSHMAADMEEVAFPFVVFHDPEDKVCLYHGSETLMDVCFSCDKTLVPMPGARHGIIVTAYESFVSQATQWMRKRL